jgi:hypothetical protein
MREHTRGNRVVDGVARRVATGRVDGVELHTANAVGAKEPHD